MSSPSFRRQKCQVKWEKGCFALPNKLVQNKSLTDSAFRLLSWMVSCSDDWIIYQTDIMERFDWGREKLKAAIDNLVECKYLFKFPQRILEDGKYGPCDYEFTAQGFTDDEIKELEIKFTMYGNPTSTAPTSTDHTSKQLLIPTTPNPKVVCREGPIGPAFQNRKRDSENEGPNGTKVTTNLEEVFQRANAERKEWDLLEIQGAWQILCDYKGMVRDGFAFIDGTIKNMRNRQKGEQYSKTKDKSCKDQQKSKDSTSTNLRPHPGNCKSSSSESDTLASQWLPSWERLKLSENGSPDSNTSSFGPEHQEPEKPTSAPQ